MKKLKHIMKGIKWKNILFMILIIFMIALSIKCIINNINSTDNCRWSESECEIFEEHKYDMQKFLEN